MPNCCPSRSREPYRAMEMMDRSVAPDGSRRTQHDKWQEACHPDHPKPWLTHRQRICSSSISTQSELLGGYSQPATLIITCACAGRNVGPMEDYSTNAIDCFGPGGEHPNRVFASFTLVSRPYGSTARPGKLCRQSPHSHSIVAGGFPEMS